MQLTQNRSYYMVYARSGKAVTITMTFSNVGHIFLEKADSVSMIEEHTHVAVYLTKLL